MEKRDEEIVSLKGHLEQKKNQGSDEDPNEEE